MVPHLSIAALVTALVAMVVSEFDWWRATPLRDCAAHRPTAEQLRVADEVFRLYRLDRQAAIERTMTKLAKASIDERLPGPERVAAFDQLATLRTEWSTWDHRTPRLRTDSKCNFRFEFH